MGTTRTTDGTYRIFWVVFIGMVLAGAGLILLTPSLVHAGSTLHWALAAALGLTFVGGALAVRRMRPDRQGR